MQSTIRQDHELNDVLVNPSSRWLRLARPIALLFILFCLALFIAGLFALPGYAGRYPEAFAAYAWSPQDMDQILSRIGLSFANWIGFQVITTIFTALVFCTTGLFLFLRRSIDHRFYHRRYNAENTLQSFAATLRDEVDLDQLRSHIISVIQETMQPEHVSVWIKPVNQNRI